MGLEASNGSREKLKKNRSEKLKDRFWKTLGILLISGHGLDIAIKTSDTYTWKKEAIVKDNESKEDLTNLSLLGTSLKEELKRKIDYITAGSLDSISESLKDDAEKLEIATEDIPTSEGVIPEEDLKKFLSSFPDNWASGEIRSILAQERSKSVLGYEFKRSAEFKIILLNERGNVVLFAPQELSLERILHIIRHEIAHGNDFDTDKDLTPQEKAKLEADLKKRILSPDRYRSPVVEDLLMSPSSVIDPVAEYWAEIGAQYFEDPTKLPRADFNIVNRVVKKNDPKYDWKKGYVKHRGVSRAIIKKLRQKPRR